MREAEEKGRSAGNKGVGKLFRCIFLKAELILVRKPVYALGPVIP